ncbi:unnamed protein product [Paramecium octaurelia]|uniref:Transmembrane protein n=1 Tax=Paramecium octaurelia TaxID=43137 RepID=A0A8S1VPE5_PAROT|nr:unnamed protein product [Paramecium octaurelia]
MILLLSFFNCFLTAEVLNLTTKTLTIKDSYGGIVEVIQGSEYKLKNFENAEYAINIELKKNSTSTKDICFSKQSTIYFGDYESHHKVIYNSTLNPDEEHANDPSYYLSSPIMINMVHTKQGLAIVTSDHTLLNYKVIQNYSSKTGFSTQLLSTVDFKSLRKHATELEVPQIIYVPYNEYIYIIYSDQIIGGKAENNIELATIQFSGFQTQNSYINQIKVYHNFLFIPAGSDGLHIYRFQESGNINYDSTLSSSNLFFKVVPIHLTDIVFSTSNQTYAYILDQLNGVSRFLVKTDKLKVELTRDNLFGLVPIKNAMSLAVSPDEYLLVLKQVGVFQQLIEVGLYNSEWFFLKTHHLTGQYFDIDIGPTFVLLRGKDEHRIIRVGIYEEFEPDYVFYSYDDQYTEKANSFHEQYVFIPKLQDVEFYNDNFAIGNDPSKWSFNQSFPFILGLTQHTIVEIPYISQPPYVYCSPSSDEDIGIVYQYDINLYSTACPEKDQYLEDNPTIPFQTVQCLYQETFKVKAIQAQGKLYDTQFQVIIIFCLILILTAVIFTLIILYRKYHKQEESLTSSIQGFENSRGYDFEPNEGPQ